MPVDSAASERPVTAELRITTEDMLRLATRATDEEAIRDINLYLFGRSNGQSLHFYSRSALVKATGIDKKTCRKLVESDGTWVYIKRQVDVDDVAALEKKNLPGVLFEQAMKRVYPYGNLADI